MPNTILFIFFFKPFFFNILSAWICLFCILFFFGIATFSPEVGKVLENSPASMNDIREGDIISRVNGYEIKDFSDISRTFDKSNFVSIEIVRNNDLILKEFELKYNNEMNKYIIGISSTNTPIINRFSLFNSLTQSIIFIPTYYSSEHLMPVAISNIFFIKIPS